MYQITVGAAKDLSTAIIPTCELSFRSEIPESDREAIDRSLIPWDSPVSKEADLDDVGDEVKADSVLRLPFFLRDLCPRPRKKRSTSSLGTQNEGTPSAKLVNINLTSSTTLQEEVEPKQNLGLPLDTTSNLKPVRKGIWDVSKATTQPVNIYPPQDRKPDKPLSLPSALPSFAPPLLTIKDLPLGIPTKITPFLPQEYICALGAGPINLIDTHTGKILATRHPNGGYGYDPAVNWTPETSFNDGGSKAPSETLVPINPGSKLLVPRNRIPQDERFPFANREALWGIPGQGQNDASRLPATPSGNEDGNGEDDDDKTIVASEEDASTASSLTTQNSYLPNQILNLDTSFSDVLVLRHEGDTSFTSPSTMQCSAAAHMLDIAEVKYAAEKLFAAHERSREVSLRMAEWLEGKVRREVRREVRAAKRGREKVIGPRVGEVAEEMRRRVVVERWRVEGDEGGELEMKWADWFVDAAGRGVLHLKVEGCTCRPEPLVEGSDKDGGS